MKSLLAVSPKSAITATGDDATTCSPPRTSDR